MDSNEGFLFDECEYLQLIRWAKIKFRFIDIHEFSSQVGVCIWRHDVDISPHRALALARLEYQEGIRGHYYFLFESRFYNLLEPDIVHIVREIESLGHHIGLHFDPSNLLRLDLSDIEKSIDAKIGLLSDIKRAPTTSISIHDPGKVVHDCWTSEEIGGLLNATSAKLRGNFTYCSDSNGYWRSASLKSVISCPKTLNLYALTHPGWWVPEQYQSPSQRIQRAVEGRAERVIKDYYKDLKAQKRLESGV